MAVDALKLLKDKGYDLNWYWAGGSDGDARKEYKNISTNRGLTAEFISRGNVKNPYPLYSSCDVYVQTSLCESYCISLAEAAFLSRKIVSTDFPTAYEILGDFNEKEITGKTAESLSEGIEKILKRDFRPPQRLRADFEGETQRFISFITQ